MVNPSMAERGTGEQGIGGHVQMTERISMLLLKRKAVSESKGYLGSVARKIPYAPRRLVRSAHCVGEVCPNWLPGEHRIEAKRCQTKATRCPR